VSMSRAGVLGEHGISGSWFSILPSDDQRGLGLRRILRLECFVFLDLSDLNREIISLRSTMQILHCSVREDFTHLIPSPCQRIIGAMMAFIM